MNPTIAAYISARKTERCFNAYFAVLHGLVISGGVYAIVTIGSPAQVLLAALVGIGAIGLFQGFANVCLILARPRIDATNDEIVAAAENGPPWFRKLVARLSDQKTAAES